MVAYYESILQCELTDQKNPLTNRPEESRKPACWPVAHAIATGKNVLLRLPMFPQLTSVTQVPLVASMNSYYMVIFPKLTLVTRVPLVEPIKSYYMVIFPKLTSVTRVPLVEPINSYYMVIFPKLSSVIAIWAKCSREVTYPGKSHFQRIHISWELTFPRKSHFPRSHTSREVTFPNK